jgi:hypothetical protein
MRFTTLAVTCLLLLALVNASNNAHRKRPTRRNRFVRQQGEEDFEGDEKEVFPFRPANVQPGTSKDASVIEYSDEVGNEKRRGKGREGPSNRERIEEVVRNWWNWLWGTNSDPDSSPSTTQDSSDNRKPRQRPRRPTHTTTVTVTVTDTAVKTPETSRQEEQVRAQNARRQAAFNDWFDQDKVESRGGSTKPELVED